MRRYGPYILLALALSTTAACGDTDNTAKPATGPDTFGADTRDTAPPTGQDVMSGDVDFVKCDPFGAAVCATNEHCTYFGNNAESVCAPSGAITTGDFCGQTNRCQEGICLALNGTSPRCFDFCRDGNDCGDNACLAINDAKFSVCRVAGIYPTCELLAQNCDENKACYAVLGEPDPVCLKAGTVVAGEACNYADSCEKGAACVNSTCRTLCDPAAMGACGAGMVCTTINDTAIGFCTTE